jgi:hypothetical protein
MHHFLVEFEWLELRLQLQEGNPRVERKVSV